LRDADVFGMANSLEIRVPFLDNELVDYSLKVDSSEKMGALNKRVLAELSQDILPREIIDRKKMGFTLPFENWFKKNINHFDIDAEASKKFLSGEISWSRFWGLYVLRTWDDQINVVS